MNYIEIQNEMKKTYNGIAYKYEKEAEDDWQDKTEVDEFLKYLNKNDSILDIGCGTGELLKYYSSKGFDVTGIDIADEMIKISKNKVPNSKVLKMSLYDIDKMDCKFNAISATFILVHITKGKINEVIEKIREKLEDNGILFILLTENLKEGLQPEPLDNNYNYYAVNYSKDEVCNILENNGFEILKSKDEKRINKLDVGIVIARK